MKALRRIDSKNSSRLVLEHAANARQIVNSLVARRLSSSSPVASGTNAGTWGPSHRFQSGLQMNKRMFSLGTVPDPFEESVSATEAGSTSPAQNYMSYEVAKRLTKVLDEPDFHKLGAFSATTWKSITQLIKSWAQFKTGESVNASFELMERLLMEQEILLQNRNTISDTGNNHASNIVDGKERKEMQQLSRKLLNTDLLNSVIKNWRHCWKSNKTSLSPRQILPMLEQFIDRSPSLHPNTKTYNMVMDAVTKRFGGRESERLAEEIFQRMSSQTPLSSPKKGSTFELSPTPVWNGHLRCINDISPDQYTYATLMHVYAYSKKPKAAEEVLCRFTNDFLNGRTKTQPNVYAFTACIGAWARSQAPDAPEKCEAIIELMGNLEKQPPMQNVQPSVITYNALLDCWAKSGRKDAAEKALARLETMENTKELQPDIVTYNTVLYICGQTDDKMGRAEKLVQRMANRYRHMGPPYPRPDRDTYVLLLRAINCQRNNDRRAAPKAQQVLERMVRSGFQPDLLTYNYVLGCWGVSPLERTGEFAEKLLNIMKAPPPDLRIHPVEPNILSYTSVVNAYANNNQAEKAESFFWGMYKHCSPEERKVKPTVRTFNTVLSAWTRAPGISNSERMQKMLGLFEKVPKSGVLGIRPDVVSCNTLLHVLAEISSEESRVHAERVLAEIEGEYKETKDPALRPDVTTYSCVMRAHANVGDLTATRNVFNRMLEDYKSGNETARPDVFAFNHLLLAIARGSRGRNLGAGRLADKIFQQARELYEAGIVRELPNKKSYDIKINCWATSGSKHAGDEADRIIHEMEGKAANGSPELQPDMMTFSTAIKAHANCANHIAAEAYLKRMLDEYGKGNQKMRPSLRTINTVLAAFAKANNPEAAKKADAYLRDLLLFEGSSSLDLKPDVVTFTAVISAWANSGDPRAGERALSLVEDVEVLSRKHGSNLKLDSGFYRSVIQACALSGDTATAEALIEKINNRELKNVKADRYMYNALLMAYANSRDKDAAEKAEAILKQMNELALSSGNSFVRPHAECYMRVLECWAYSEDLEKAAGRSEMLLLEMEDRGKRFVEVKPTPAAYSSVINMMARAGNKERTKALLKRMYDKGGNIEASAPVYAT